MGSVRLKEVLVKCGVRFRDVFGKGGVHEGDGCLREVLMKGGVCEGTCPLM